MNYNIIRYFMGKIMLILAVLLLIPLAVSVGFGENILLAYLIPIGILFLAGAGCLAKKPENKEVHIKEGFFICSFTWIIMSLMGALPFYLSGEIPSYTDAFFETVSGFTTTGSTILTNIEGMSKSLLFWRAFTHWIGGMGVLVFVLAIFSQKDTKTMFIMRAEVPGPKVGKLVSKTKLTARILYGIYIGLTVVEAIFLMLGKMPLFDSITTAMATAGTGGFAVKNASIAAYNSAYIEYVVAIFMMLFGVNFTLYYFILLKNFRDVYKNEELRWYMCIILGATLLIGSNIFSLYHNVERAFREAFFTVASLITTTGFITADYETWPLFSQAIVFILLFFGACAGSTGGGLKIIRIATLIKMSLREIKKAINPKAVVSVNMDSRPLEENMVTRTVAYFTVYMIVIAISILFLAFDRLNIMECISAVVTCVNNVGPGFGKVGAVGNFSELSVFSKWILSFDMLAGRLELYPVLIMFHPSFWR